MKTIFLSSLVILGAALASTTASASIVLSLGSETIGPAGTAAVDLNVAGLTPGTTALGTYDINVGFNSSVVIFGSASYGDPVLGDQLDLEGFGAITTTTPGTGSVELFELSLDSTSALTLSQPASFTLATLSFNAQGTGVSPLTLSINALGDQYGNGLVGSTQNGSITVATAPVPLPATMWLLMSGLLGVAAFARKTSQAG
jgi:hypothetical protein